MERIVIEEDLNERIDSYISKNTDYSRSKVVKMIEEEAILVNDTKVKNSYHLKKGDIISILEYKEEEMNINPENIAVVGDQIFTDVIGANRNKMISILVEPISRKDIWVTKLKRPIEEYIVNRYINKLKEEK